MTAPDRRPLIAHVLHRFAIGGLENGVVNLINHLPKDEFRHAIICVTDHDPEFAKRLQRTDVPIIELHKQSGQDPKVWWRAYKVFRQLRPSVVHTRNLSALEAQLAAFFAGVPGRIHGEHGRDVSDLHGLNRKHRWLRRLVLPFAQQVIALSDDLALYLTRDVGIRAGKITTLCNGVDTSRFTPAAREYGARLTLISVGRLQAVKDPLNVLRAFAALVAQRPEAPLRLRLLGDGPLMTECQAFVAQHDLQSKVELAGASSAVAEALREAHVFVLGSQAEGISNTVLEAMASGLPVVATRVGGNAELVAEGETGALVPAGDAQALAAALLPYVDDRARLAAHAQAARARAEKHFSLHGMMQKYAAVYRRAAGLQSAEAARPLPEKG